MYRLFSRGTLLLLLFLYFLLLFLIHSLLSCFTKCYCTIHLRIWCMQSMPMSNRATKVVPHSHTHTHVKAIVNHHRACSRSRSQRKRLLLLFRLLCCCFVDVSVYVLYFYRQFTQAHDIPIHICSISLSLCRCYRCMLACFGAGILLSLSQWKKVCVPVEWGDKGKEEGKKL